MVGAMFGRPTLLEDHSKEKSGIHKKSDLAYKEYKKKHLVAQNKSKKH